MKHVLIAGGGFAGIRLARKLKKQKNLSVTVVNSSPDFKYCPALYRAATGYKMGTARIPLEWMLLDVENADLLVDTLTSVDIDKQSATCSSGKKLTFDYVAFALGSNTTYFSIEGLHEHAFGIKSGDEVEELRKHLHEQVSRQPQAERNYVVVGGGPTGVELSAALGSYLKKISKKHGVQQSKIKIWLVEAKPSILPSMSKKASLSATRRLKKLGVELLLETTVKKESLHQLSTSAGPIKTDTVIWTAGTMLNDFYSKNSGFTIDSHHKITVNKHLESAKDVYVMGDNASTRFSGLAQTAIKHANFVAKDIVAKETKKQRPTTYESKPIQIVPVGHKWAVAQYGSFSFKGRFAHLLRWFADYVGYGDVMGYLRAITIWKNVSTKEDACTICHS